MRNGAGIAALLAVALILGAVQVSAAALILTKDSVSRFVASLPEVRLIALREGLTISGQAKANANPIGAIVQAVTRKELRKEVEGVVSRHGFRSVKDWAQTGRSIGQAYVHITAAPVAGTVSSQMQEHRDDVAKEVEKLGFLSDKQKKKLMEKYDEAGNDINKEPPQQNVAIVTEMKPQIEAVMKLGMN
jgi:hypothetical protein